MAPRHPKPPVRTDKRLPLPLIDSPAFVLMQAGQIAYEWVREAVEPYELTVSQFAAMMVVNRLGPVAQAWLAGRLGMSRPRVVALVSALERDGWVERRGSVRDARERRVCLTAGGLELLAEVADEVAAVEVELGNSLPDRVRKRLAQLPPEELPVALSALQRVLR